MSQADVITKCPRSTDDINDCICKSIELLRTNLANGDFGENFTIPKIEPMYIDEIKMQRGMLMNGMCARCDMFKLFQLQEMNLRRALKIFSFPGRVSLLWRTWSELLGKVDNVEDEVKNLNLQSERGRQKIWFRFGAAVLGVHRRLFNRIEAFGQNFRAWKV